MEERRQEKQYPKKGAIVREREEHRDDGERKHLKYGAVQLIELVNDHTRLHVTSCHHFFCGLLIGWKINQRSNLQVSSVLGDSGDAILQAKYTVLPLKLEQSGSAHSTRKRH